MGDKPAVKDRDVYHHSNDESEKCKQMLNDKEFIMPITEGRNRADVYP